MRQFIACTDTEGNRILIRKSCVEFVEQCNGRTKLWLSNGCTEYVQETVDAVGEQLESDN